MRSVLEIMAAFFIRIYLVDAIERVQKRALKIIIPKVEYRIALVMADLPSLEVRRKAFCTKFMKSLD